MSDLKFIFKGVFYLFLRLLLVCILGFMAIPLLRMAPDILPPVLAVFYAFVLLYFFVFTMWHEGGRDSNRVATGTLKKNMAKGFICSGTLAVISSVLVIIPMFFSSEATGVFNTVFSVIRVVLLMSVSYITKTIVGETASMTVATTVYLVMMAACVIGSGIGYIVGYKKILIFAPYMEKIKKMWK